MSLHHARARRHLRLAQFSAIGLAATAGILAAMPMREPRSAPSIKPAGTPTKTSAPMESPSLDLTTASDVLASFAKKRPGTPIETPPKAPAAETPKGTDAKEGIEIDPGSHQPHFRYLCYVSSPRRDYAIIESESGETSTVAQGEAIGDFILLGISPTRLIIADCDDNRYEHLIEERPAQAPPDTSVANLVGTPNPALAKPAESTPYTNIPPGVTNPEEWKRVQEANAERLKEWREKQAANAHNGVQQPPPRSTSGIPQPRPITPSAGKVPGKNNEPK